jgi:hypothetical protein
MAAASRNAIKAGAADAEVQARAALEILVDAFLVDRQGNRDCFARAHALGRRVNLTFGCHASYDSDSDCYGNDCGILALHSRFGLSPGGPTVGICTVCGAGDFECDHVPGRLYEGQVCRRVIREWDVREVSVVSVPHDPRCYRINRVETRDVVERALGRALKEDELPECRHCQECRGTPSTDDLDPSRWTALPRG